MCACSNWRLSEKTFVDWSFIHRQQKFPSIQIVLESCFENIERALNHKMNKVLNRWLLSRKKDVAHVETVKQLLFSRKILVTFSYLLVLLLIRQIITMSQELACFIDFLWSIITLIPEFHIRSMPDKTTMSKELIYFIDFLWTVVWFCNVMIMMCNLLKLLFYLLRRSEESNRLHND